MDISSTIAHLLGIFFVVTGIAMVVNSKAVAAAIEESMQNKGIVWLWGILALSVGAVVVVFNNMWTSGLPLLVTVLGWLAIVKGAFILILPGTAASFYKKFSRNGMIAFCGVVAFVIGLVLCW